MDKPNTELPHGGPAGNLRGSPEKRPPGPWPRRLVPRRLCVAVGAAMILGAGWLGLSLLNKPIRANRVAAQIAVARWEGLIKQLQLGCDRQTAEMWFSRNGCKAEFTEDTRGDQVNGRTVAALAGIKDEDLGGMLRGTIGYKELNLRPGTGGSLCVYLFFDKQGRLVGHYVYVELIYW